MKRETIPLVKTTSPARLGENMAYSEFDLTDEDVAKIDALDKNARLFNPKYLSMEYDWNFMPYFD